jgi:asparagine synthase (glutamine-hydrolysing)
MMCGIYGQFDVDADPEIRARFAVTAEQALRHRGPDGVGRWQDGRCVLGHTRLGVLDPGPNGAQPMAASSGRTVVVFNGEIYNFVEMRATLAAPEGGWRSTGDTEVLVEALDRRGLAALDDTLGMFAIAWWRPGERELWLARDRVGKKPLYYAHTPSGGLRFASEIGALFADGVLTPATSYDRLAEYLQHGYVAAPRSGFCGVNVLPPGGYLRAQLAHGKIAIDLGRWWRLPDARHAAAPSRFRDEHEFREAFDATLQDAVRIRLRSDVPLGAFLSGGVDSSVVSLLASRHLGRPLRTFTADFDEAAFSEGGFASDVARSLGAEHTTLRVSSSAMASLPELVAVYGDLHGDATALPTLAVCRRAREHVTVALSGDGGDELGGGYTRYRLAQRLQQAAARLPGAARAAVRQIGARLPWWLRGTTWLGRVSANIDEVYARALWAYTPHAWPAVLKRSARAEWSDSVATALAEQAGRSPLMRMMACDLLGYLPEDVLVKVDRASMACGLEVRAPFLDHRLVELTLDADPAWIADERGGKRALRAAHASQLPAHVFDRPKQGFALPLSPWLRGAQAREAAERLLDPRSRVAEVLEPRAVRQLFRNHRLRHRDESARIWNLLVLQAWFEQWRPRVTA